MRLTDDSIRAPNFSKYRRNVDTCARQQYAQLIGLKIRATGAIDIKAVFQFLDRVFCIARAQYIFS